MRRAQALMLAATLCASTVATAESVSDENLENCRAYSEVAAMVMEKRQKGAAMADAMEAASSSRINRRLAQDLVLDAYRREIEESSNERQRAVWKFRDSIYAYCFGIFAKDERD